MEYVNKTFGKWIIVSYEGKRSTIRHWYKAKCDCGNESIIERSTFVRMRSTQCRSCARKISTTAEKNPAYTHGYSSLNHPFFKIYSCWVSMKSRCTRKTDKNYSRYGARGISVCHEWMGSFEIFLQDMGHPPETFSLDRIDINGNYCKENCRWANDETQYNNCQKTIYYLYQGEKLSETQWGRKLNISRNKFMHWARKYGIDWVIENLTKIKEIRRGSSDEDYILSGFPIPNKRFRE